MARYRGPISLRLAVGFVLALGALASALLLTLNRFGTVRLAAQRVRRQLEIREQSVRAEHAARDLLATHRDMLPQAGVNPEAWTDFHHMFGEMEYLVEWLHSRRDTMPERQRKLLARMYGALEEFRRLLEETGAGNPPEVGPEALSPESRRRLRGEGAGALRRVVEGSQNLTRFAYVLMAQAATDADAAWNITIAMAQVALPLALLAAVLVIYYTHRAVVRPIEALVRGTQKLARGDFNERIEVPGAAEFNELADSFNQMAEALESNQKRLVEAEKLATVGRLAAGVAHEINNPITVIIGYAKMLQGQLDADDPSREQLQDIALEAQQCKRIVESLLDLSRPSKSAAGEVLNPSELIGEVVNMTRALQFGEVGQIEESVLDKPLPLTINRLRLRQLALNIIRNGLEALHEEPKGRLRVEGYVRPRSKVAPEHLRQSGSRNSSFLVLIFTDNGPGISREHLEHLFEPFFSTKAEGMGLGLAICRHIVNSHGGFIHAESGDGEGTTFMVGLPIEDERE